MPGRISSGGGLRRRLTIAFTLAVGASAAALAAGSYVVVRHNLLADSVDSAVSQARRNLVIAPGYLQRGGPDALRTAYQGRGDFETVGIYRGRPFESSFSVAWHRVPWTKGGWASWSADGRKTTYAAMAKGDRRMYFAGDHMTYQIGWMNGALESGRSVATAIHARAPQEVRTTA